MDLLYHRTSALLEEAGRHFSRLERCSPENSAETEAKIQSLLDSVWECCGRLEAEGERWRLEQLKYDHRHYQSALQAHTQRRVRAQQERSDLLHHEHTSIPMGGSGGGLGVADGGVDDLLGQGTAILHTLREQRNTMKGVRRRLLDLSTTLGLSGSVMRLIEKRTRQDKCLLVGGMLLCTALMALVYHYWG